VIVHRAARARGVARADRLVDLAVRLGGIAQVAVGRALDRAAPALVIERGHHADQRPDDRVLRRVGDAAMKVDVVEEEELGIVAVGEHARDLFGERREVLGRRALRGEGRRLHLEDPPRLVHLVTREAVQRGEKAQRLGSERGRAVGDVGPRAVPRPHDPHRRERVQSRADRGTADADLRRKLALAGQPVARPEPPAHDEIAHERDDLVGAALGHQWSDQLYARGARCGARGARCGVRLRSQVA
jgi:hypothetical protein